MINDRVWCGYHNITSNIIRVLFCVKLWNEKKSFQFHENIVENLDGTAVLVLGIKAQVNSNENEDSTKMIE